MTVRAIGPTVSWLCAIGTTPARLVRPTVGLTPTSPQAAAGDRIEPSVSVPSVTAARLAAAATAEPELEPDAVRSRTYGLRVRPPRALQPLEEPVPRKFAHSDRLVLPSRTAPASRSRRTTVASASGGCPTSASEPAVVCIPSAVAMLSLTITGMPCRGPRTRPATRSASRSRAVASASSASSTTDRSAGPARSSAATRRR